MVLWPPTANEVADQRASSNTPPPKPPDYVLIAILADVGTGGPPDSWKAVLYDPDEDRLHTVASGDHVGRFEVRVAAEVVQLTDGATRHELRLRETRTPSEGAVRG